MAITKSLLLALAALSFTLPSNANHHGHQQTLHHHEMYQQPTKRVAIIGAGSAGSSTAHYLRRISANTTHTPPVNITIFERHGYVGGRSTTVNAHDDPAYPIELGASIFVSVNRNLVSAAEEFGLTVSSVSMRPETVKDEIGVFDGDSMVFVQPYTEGKLGRFWSLARLVYQYGPFAPFRAKRLTDETVGKFLGMYESPVFPFTSLSEAAETVGLLEVTGLTGEQFLAEKGVSGKFTTELMQASTRVNYGQNLGLIHGLETMVCMAAEGAVSVEGGNWQIFHGMAKNSGAQVRLRTAVTGIKGHDSDGGKVWRIASRTQGAKEAVEEEFDEVVIAAPYQFLDLTHQPELDRTPDKIPYVTLHVTLFTSRRPLDPSYFNLAPGSQAPKTVMTTLNQTEQSQESFTRGEGAAGVGNVGFFSVSTLRQIVTEKHGVEFVYKVFSPTHFGDNRIREVLGIAGEKEMEEEVTWMLRHTWHSYPYLYPRVTFEDIKLAQGMWYTAGIESFISTMETSSLMGMNVAKLIVESWKGGRVPQSKAKL